MPVSANDVYRDFTGLSNVNPWTDAGFRYISTPRFEVNTGGIRPVSGLPVAMFDELFTDDTCICEITIVSNIGSFSDPVGPCIFVNGGAEDGYGYLFECNATALRIRRRDAATGSGTAVGVQFAPAVTLANGDIMTLQYIKSTGELTAYQNGTLLATRTDTTYQADDLSPAVYGSRDNNGGRRVGEFGATGIDLLPTISSVNAGTLLAGSTGNTITFSGAFALSSLSIGGVSATAITEVEPDEFTFSFPALADNTSHPGFGTRTITASNGVDSITLSISYLPQTGYTFQTLAGDLDTTTDASVIKDFDPAAAVTDQIAHRTETTVNADGTGSTTITGAQTAWHWDASTTTIYSYEILTGTLDGGGLTARRLTASGLTARALTAKRL